MRAICLSLFASIPFLAGAADTDLSFAPVHYRPLPADFIRAAKRFSQPELAL